MKLLLCCLPFLKVFRCLLGACLMLGYYSRDLSDSCQDAECCVAKCDFLQRKLNAVEHKLVIVHDYLTFTVCHYDWANLLLTPRLYCYDAVAVFVSDFKLRLSCTITHLDVHLVKRSIYVVQVNFYWSCNFHIAYVWRYLVAHV